MFGSISKSDHHELMENGEHAQAVVLEAKVLSIASAPIRFAKLGGVRAGTGTHAVMTRLRVEPTEGEPFEVKRRLRFPEGTPREPGTRIDVVFDPADPEKLILDPDSWAGAKPRRS